VQVQQELVQTVRQVVVAELQVMVLLHQEQLLALVALVVAVAVQVQLLAQVAQEYFTFSIRMELL